jgi:P27 family predicted phage terminase small subunit
MRGRKPTPARLRLLQGAAPASQRVRPGGPAPECPEWLDAEAKAEWVRVVPLLASQGVLLAVDAAALAAYCQTYSDWRKAAEQVRADGQTFRDAKGNIRVHPAAKLCLSLLSEMRRTAAEFGFTPAARSRIDTPPPQTGEQDDFEQFQRGADVG